MTVEHESAEVVAEAVAQKRTEQPPVIPTETVLVTKAWVSHPYARDALDVYVVRYVQRTDGKNQTFRSERLVLNGEEPGDVHWETYDPAAEIEPLFSISGRAMIRGDIKPRDLALIKRLARQMEPIDVFTRDHR